MYTVVDLFAGAGGLSLGFMQTQKYDIKVAFEKIPHMQDTYRRNHPHVDIQGDVCAADYADIKRRYGDIDVVIGGPPCQGFSNANRQKNTAINQNNMLVKQYLRAILELQPKAFVMENVSIIKFLFRIHTNQFQINPVGIVSGRKCSFPPSQQIHSFIFIQAKCQTDANKHRYTYIFHCAMSDFTHRRLIKPSEKRKLCFAQSSTISVKIQILPKRGSIC